jgi:hypothetical protein
MKLLEQAGYKLDQIKKDQMPGKARLSEYDVYTAGGKLYVGPKGQAGVPLSSFRGTSTGLTFNAMKAVVNAKFGLGIGRGGVRSGGGRTPQPPGGGAGREAGRELE